MNRLLEMAGEASTWRGAVAVAGAAGIAVSPDQSNAIVALALAIIGLINVFRKEAKPNATVNTPPAG